MMVRTGEEKDRCRTKKSKVGTSKLTQTFLRGIQKKDGDML